MVESSRKDLIYKDGKMELKLSKNIEGMKEELSNEKLKSIIDDIKKLSAELKWSPGKYLNRTSQDP